LANWAKVVITYLLSDFFGLWQAMQFSTRMGATSRMKLTGFAAGAVAGFAGNDAAGAGDDARVLALPPSALTVEPADPLPALRAARAEPVPVPAELGDAGDFFLA
jgi:hypothetical protein